MIINNLKSFAGSATLTLLLMLSAVLVTAQPNGYYPMKDVDSFKKALQNSAQETTTIDCDFVQTKYMSFLSEDIVTDGHLSFKKEDKLRWEYTSPFEYLIVLNEGKIFIKDEDQLTTYDMESNPTFQKINDMILTSVQGDVLDDSMYRIEFYENSEHLFLRLFPKEEGMKEFIKQILLYFDRENYTVDRIQMHETSGDKTDLVFKNKRINTPLADENFVVD